MKYLAELETAIKKDGTSELAAKVMPLVKPGILFRKRFQTTMVEQPPLFFGWFKQGPKEVRQGLPVAPGASRIGGLPELPVGAAWPLHEDMPMQFLAQINCAELAEFHEILPLPKSGVLHFFQNDYGEGGRVTFTAGDVPLQTAAAPSGIKVSKFVLPQFPVGFVPIPTLPHAESKEFGALGLDEGDAECVFNAHGDILEELRRQEHALHQMGGYPEAVQGDVLTECEKHSNGKKQSWEEAAENAHQWRLLLQFDTDGDLDVMWGDAGTIYFCIREDDLRAGRFDKMQSTMQCG